MNDSAMIKGRFVWAFSFLVFVLVMAATVYLHEAWSQPKTKIERLGATPITNSMSVGEVRARLGDPQQTLPCGQINAQMEGSMCDIFSDGGGWLLIFSYIPTQ